ncbi:hypothetical protein [Actinomadura sp. BRA 177]|uniref:hypothetical protein n=1 Tax=Actinomadura sp. BRA 177 TaxID=2745202 RepID=UPI00159631F1|nr:hypothetical protein [Actinomadura sp. BRA 177]NVI86676.1 hypothetical protein [Actinomadura sp. BRA 177]
MDDWQWRAWVGHPSGGKLGAAFLVTETRLLTCAHTVHGLDEARVGFPGLLEDLPVKVVRRGGWQRLGDLGDVAVLELAAPIQVPPAQLAGPDQARDLAADFRRPGPPRVSAGIYAATSIQVRGLTGKLLRHLERSPEDEVYLNLDPPACAVLLLEGPTSDGRVPGCGVLTQGDDSRPVQVAVTP